MIKAAKNMQFLHKLSLNPCLNMFYLKVNKTHNIFGKPCNKMVESGNPSPWMDHESHLLLTPTVYVKSYPHLPPPPPLQ